VFVIGENRDLMKAFSLFMNRDSPPILGISNTHDYTMPMLFNYTFHHAELLTSLVMFEPNW
jgi:hypothetical protein